MGRLHVPIGNRYISEIVIVVTMLVVMFAVAFADVCFHPQAEADLNEQSGQRN